MRYQITYATYSNHPLTASTEAQVANVRVHNNFGTKVSDLVRRQDLHVSNMTVFINFKELQVTSASVEYELIAHRFSDQSCSQVFSL